MSGKLANSSAPPIHYPFWFGGSSSCVAACVTHPLDLTKVRMQTSKGPKLGFIGTVLNVFRKEGFFALYSGLSASLLRQATYSTVRFGVYEELKVRMGPSPHALQLAAAAAFSGVCGGIVGNPADIINIRMQNDKSLPIEQRRNYKNAIDGLIKLVKYEGISSTMRGVVPNACRSALMTASQLATYDKCKSICIKSGFFDTDSLGLHFCSSLGAGFVATTVCSPVDVLKTRVMSAGHNSGGALNILKETFKQEGLRFMFRGWLPSFIRLAPHTITTFIALEQHKRLYRAWHQTTVNV